MRSFIKFFLSISLVFAPLAYADEDANQPARLPFWSIITDIPATAKDGMKSSFQKDAWEGWAWMLGTSAVLYHYDQDLVDDVQKKGRDWNLGNNVNYKSVVEIGSTTLYAAPTDTAGWLYFMGDGTIPILVSAGLVGTGYFKGRNKLFNTGIEMANGLLTGTVFTQVIKRVTGRESPNAATEPRGKFQWFPNLKAYSSNTSKYDAMPSGHIMTATVMLTVLSQEYPEYNYFWIPFEVAWIGVLGFGMMNVGVHWASDYPLGIAIGYVIGKAAVRTHHPEMQDKKQSWRILPGVDPDSGTPTMNFVYRF